MEEHDVWVRNHCASNADSSLFGRCNLVLPTEVGVEADLWGPVSYANTTTLEHEMIIILAFALFGVDLFTEVAIMHLYQLMIVAHVIARPLSADVAAVRLLPVR